MINVWKVIAVWAAKLPPILKLAMVVTVAATTAIIAGLPVNDIWFDYALFVVVSSVVSGMPEPDTDLSLPRFMYTWLYRSAHLLVASSTAYFMHQEHWGDISGRSPLPGRRDHGAVPAGPDVRS